MTRVLGVVLVGAIALPAQAAPRARPQGKVVRVERARGPAVIPRICDIKADKKGTCLGTRPGVGEVVMVLDETGVVAQVRINEVTEFSSGIGASCNVLWQITTDVIAGDLSAIPGRTVGLIDPEVHPHNARIFAQTSMPDPPSGNSNDKVVAAIDRNGDGNPDVVIAQTACEDHGSPPNTGMCFDEWSRVGGKLAKVQQTNFSACGF